MRAPFPWFGGKSAVAADVWARLGEVTQYIEPAAGSLAVYFRRPPSVRHSVLGDQNRWVVNFWRAIKYHSRELADMTEFPVSHADLHSRHKYLMSPEQIAAVDAGLMGDPKWCDVELAAWWVWGQCAWIGSGWCVDGRAPKGSIGQIPHLGRPQGVQRGQLLEWFQSLSDSLAPATLIHGDWRRTINTYRGAGSGGITGIFLDPVYKKFSSMYSDGEHMAAEMEEWCRSHENDRGVRIAICGHRGDYRLDGWIVHEWKRPSGTFGGTGTGASECIWFSPGCVKQRRAQMMLEVP